MRLGLLILDGAFPVEHISRLVQSVHSLMLVDIVGRVAELILRFVVGILSISKVSGRRVLIDFDAFILNLNLSTRL